VYSVQQCIRPVSIRSGLNAHPRVLVLINLAAFSSFLGTQIFQDASRLLSHLVIVSLNRVLTSTCVSQLRTTFAVISAPLSDRMCLGTARMSMMSVIV
jgi:hypothetical protein